MKATGTSFLLVLALGIASCSLFSTIGATQKVSCSVGGGRAFDPIYLDGPQMSTSEFVATPVGSVLRDFFVGGEGEPENGSFLRSDGFSIVSDSYVLGYRDGAPTADFFVDDGDIQAWGGCNPTWVYGDRVAGRWHPVGPIDATATVIPISVEGDACVDGRETDIITEIVEMEVSETADTVEIIAWTREEGFRGMCAGIGVELPAEAVLDSPLGTRRLLDFGRNPPFEPDRYGTLPES